LHIGDLIPWKEGRLIGEVKMIGNAFSHFFWSPGGCSRISIFAKFLVGATDADWLMTFLIHFLAGCAKYTLFLQPVEAGSTSHLKSLEEVSSALNCICSIQADFGTAPCHPGIDPNFLYLLQDCDPVFPSTMEP
jgi:hypothetical protein